MTNYRRLRIEGGCYFFTVALYDRRSKQLIDHVDQLRVAFAEVNKRHPFHVDAIVILPEHLHCIWTLPDGDCDFSMRWRQIKANFSRQLPSIEARSDSREKKGERGIWQRRFWEHAIRDQTDFQRHVNYVHFNPVKHGWVSRVANWPYSSFTKYVEKGIYPINWGAEYDDKTLDVWE